MQKMLFKKFWQHPTCCLSALDDFLLQSDDLLACLKNIAMLQQERPGFMFVSELGYNKVLMTNFDPNVV
jgi:hypothetical protein